MERSRCQPYPRAEYVLDIRASLFSSGLLNRPAPPQIQISEHKLHQQHIADGPSRDGEQHLPFPQMERDHQGYGNEFRETMAAGEDAYVLQAIDDEQSENRRGENFPEILNIFRSGASCRKYEERKETGQHGGKDYHGCGYDLLCECHGCSPPFSVSFAISADGLIRVSSGLRITVRRIRITSIAGMIKLSAPNAMRQIRESASPRSELV